MSSKVILITGVSTGIGFAAAESLLQKGHTVIGTYRKEKDVQHFKSKYAKSFIGLELDVTDFAKIKALDQVFKAMKINYIDGLVNNAGIAIAGPIEYQDFAEIQNIFATNVLGLIAMTQAMIPFLRKSKQGGRIVNISSVAGQGAMPFLGVYSGAKHAVEGISQALRRELNLHSIKVSVIGPGSIKTPIWMKGFSIIAKLYDHTEYKKAFHRFIEVAADEEKNALPVQAVVDDIEHALFSKESKNRYAPVPKTRKFSSQFLPLFLSDKAYDQLICKYLNLSPKS